MFYNTNLKAFAFEILSNDGQSIYKVIEPFGVAVHESKVDFDIRVAEDREYDNTLWMTDEIEKECMLNALDTQLVGFATTNEGDNSKKIRSI